MDVRVRAAEAGDVEPMARVFVDSFRAGHPGQVPERLLLSRTYASSVAGWRRMIDELADRPEPDEYVCVAEVPARSFYERRGGRVLGRRIHHDDGVVLPETGYVWDIG
ncbi:hypothetical protein ACQEVB_06870 [Pseudonocardia sp. CA-107938]|uniref:hypothetical protein n=1 Tax=Pseudonocardia sp. CA-107938 TaxID=3240021 RepID=UPI003D8BA6FC